MRHRITPRPPPCISSLAFHSQRHRPQAFAQYRHTRLALTRKAVEMQNGAGDRAILFSIAGSGLRADVPEARSLRPICVIPAQTCSRWRTGPCRSTCRQETERGASRNRATRTPCVARRTSPMTTGRPMDPRPVSTRRTGTMRAGRSVGTRSLTAPSLCAKVGRNRRVGRREHRKIFYRPH